MLKIIKDVTIRHDGMEIFCKAGEIVNIKASFDVNDDKTKGIEVRYADKCRDFVKRVVIARGSSIKSVVLEPGRIHNQAEQKIRKEKDAVKSDEGVEVIGEDETGDDTPPEQETHDHSTKTSAKKGKTKKDK